MFGGQPDGLDVLGEGDLAAGVVVPRAVADLGLFAVRGAFGGTARGVCTGGALPAFGVAVAGDEPGVAVVGEPGLDPRHDASEGAEMLMSAQCPQTLPRSSREGGEGQRRLSMGMTCDFTLTGGGSRVECEAVCEADTALITQRSQVQILPPLLEKPQVGAGFVGLHGPGFCVSCQHDVC